MYMNRDIQLENKDEEKRKPQTRLQRIHVFGSLAALILLVIVGVFTLLPLQKSQSAHAASWNGQQLEVRLPQYYPPNHPPDAWVCVLGNNQNNVRTYHCFSINVYDNLYYNWWWKGNIRLDFYDKYWRYLYSQNATAPSFTLTDFFTVNAQR